MTKLSKSAYLSEAFSSGPTSAQTPSLRLSFVVPLKDEQSTLAELVAGIAKNVEGISHEVILIDDGSRDTSWAVIEDLSIRYPGIVRGIRFRANRGKAAALAVGFEAARGDFIFTMDADLQDDPTEIPRFLEKIEQGHDLVSGWKQVRHDPWHKVLPSRVFNRMLSRLSKVQLHDHNCGFKCYRREVAKSIRLFGELHRMVPALSGMQGFRVAEIPVKHHARRFGKSKYGIERFIRGFSDMITMWFLRVYQERPSHFTNACAFAFGAIATALLIGSLIMGWASSAGLVIAIASFIAIAFGGLTVIVGLMSELMIRLDTKPSASSAIVERSSHPERGFQFEPHLSYRRQRDNQEIM